MNDLRYLAELIESLQENLDSPDMADFKTAFFKKIRKTTHEVLQAHLRNQLFTIPEITVYPDLGEHLLATLEDALMDQQTFFLMLDCDFTDSDIIVRKIDLSFLGTYADVRAGQTAGGRRKEAPNLPGWRAIYLRSSSLSGKESLAQYTDIMQQRIAFWEGNAVAPMWYLFAHSVGGDTFPRQETIPMEDVLLADFRQEVHGLNQELNEYHISIKIKNDIIANYVEDAVKAIEEETAAPHIQSPNYKMVSGKYSLQEIVDNLDSRTWKVSRVFSRQNKRRASIYFGKTGKFTGAQLEILTDVY